MQQVVAKTKAFCRWRETTKEISLTSLNSETASQHQIQTVNELLLQFNQLQNSTKRTSISDDDSEKQMITRSLSTKLSKRQKQALRTMDKNVMAQLSDYFSCWKLKVLLEKGQSYISHLDQSLGPVDCSLDYSVFRRHLEESKSGFKNTVTVRKLSNDVVKNKVG